MTNEDSQPQETETPEPPTCGIVMPISAIADYPDEHWFDVRHILSTSIEDAGFLPLLVSDAEDIGIIQKRIIQNLYSNPVVVCDVSGKNPNVMFELGMRLAFDKPAIIVKDDKTSYSFDTAPIEHLEYPRDLRFPKIVEFQERLTEKIQATHKAATNDPNYTTFLKHFGTFSVPVLQTKEISKEDFILEEIRALKALVARPARTESATPIPVEKQMRSLCLRDCPDEQVANIQEALRGAGIDTKGAYKKSGNNHLHISIAHLAEDTKLKVLALAKAIFPRARLLPSS